MADLCLKLYIAHNVQEGIQASFMGVNKAILKTVLGLAAVVLAASPARAGTQTDAAIQSVVTAAGAAANDGKPGQAPATASAAKKLNFYTFLAGTSYWERLRGSRPTLPAAAAASAGRFKPLGYNLELSYHRRAAAQADRELRFGFDLGLFYTENEKQFDAVIIPSGRTIKGSVNCRGLYLTPSVRWLAGRAGGLRLSVGAGLGYYLADLAAQLSDGMVVESYFRKGTFGGYLSAGLNVPLSGRRPDGAAFIAEAKVHFFNFGGLGSAAQSGGDLAGPMYLFQTGFTY